ncbi:TPA: hypothetical protein DDW35_00710 [Candidatus Sumerlaeota bacterium]|nr:hypothetical protein [Candidatus Sumerlaeota bacterium]
MRTLNTKILTREQVADAARQAREAGKTVGFTSGAFDLLHAGHADYLERARQLCDILVVAVNSDESVRSYKGPSRPIVPERQRAELIAALESVDYVFLFSERRNAANIEAIQPNLYIKAADYNKSTLTSAELVERYGGKAVLLEIQQPLSTTGLLQKAVASLGGQSAQTVAADPTKFCMNVSEDTDPVCIENTKPVKMAPAVFLDRDGTINDEVGHLGDPSEFELLPLAGEGIRRFNDMGYRVVVVTNQPGIGLGLFTRQDFFRVTSAMFMKLRPFGAKIDKVYYCPHNITEDCECRKPSGSMVFRAQEDLNLDLTNSYFIGDRSTDVEAGRRAGVKTILVRTGRGGKDGEYHGAEPDYVASNLIEAAQWVLEQERGKK